MKSAATTVPDHAMRIVVADQDPRVRHAFAALIALLDYPTRVQEAGNATELIEQENVFDPAIVILDLALYDDGEHLQHIRTLCLAHRSVIAVSHLESQRSHALLAGATAFIEKGAEPDVVLQTLTDTVTFHRNATEPGSDTGVA